LESVNGNETRKLATASAAYIYAVSPAKRFVFISKKLFSLILQ